MVVKYIRGTHKVIAEHSSLLLEVHLKFMLNFNINKARWNLFESGILLMLHICLHLHIFLHIHKFLHICLYKI